MKINPDQIYLFRCPGVLGPQRTILCLFTGSRGVSFSAISFYWPYFKTDDLDSQKAVFISIMTLLWLSVSDQKTTHISERSYHHVMFLFSSLSHTLCWCETIFDPHTYILTPGSIYRTIFWPQGQYIVMIFCPPPPPHDILTPLPIIYKAVLLVMDNYYMWCIVIFT